MLKPIKKHRCPICDKIFISEVTLRNHLESKHQQELNGLSPAHYLFNLRNHKTGSQCIICRKPVKFNEQTGKYNRLCENPKCKATYIAQFKKRMMQKYGKETLLNDPEHQRVMLAHRNISDTYIYKKDKSITYTGTYELDFLKYLEYELDWDKEDLCAPAPISIPYKFEGKQHFYIPDFYLPSIDLLIEIKGSNNHYQKRDHYIELAKDKAARSSGHNYIKILDKKYDEFLDGINEGCWKRSDIDNKKKNLSYKERMVKLSESFDLSLDF